MIVIDIFVILPFHSSFVFPLHKKKVEIEIRCNESKFDSKLHQ